MAKPMDEEDDEELQRAFEMSLGPQEKPESSSPSNQSLEPSAKRSKASAESREVSVEEMTAEKSEAMRQRELRAAAAERRMSAMQTDASVASAIGATSHTASSPVAAVAAQKVEPAAKQPVRSVDKGKASAAVEGESANVGSANMGSVNVGSVSQTSSAAAVPQGTGSRRLTSAEAERLYRIVFGSGASPEVLNQWSRQGFRFSADSSTPLGLVQKEGGPCGVLAPVQALLLKHLLYQPSITGPPTAGKGPRKAAVKADLTFEDAERNRALVLAMSEALWTAGGQTSAVVASLEAPSPSGQPSDAPTPHSDASPLRADALSNISDALSRGSDALSRDSDAALEEKLRGVSLDSPASLSGVLSVVQCRTSEDLRRAVQAALPAFRSRLGALLFLVSALLSRGLDAIQGDRDDPEPPLVTRPFGHASQEIVNLLLCGQAVSNVFDGTMDLGGGMLVKGIPGSVQVGFLTLLEGLNLCKVGYHLKHPQWPIWVVGSESHYTVLFALSTEVQDESDAESREEMVRRVFDAHDTSGGGGFISPPDLEKLLTELKMNLPAATVTELGANEIILWQDFWQAACNLDRSQGGYKGLSTPNQKRQFELFHFNGIAKSISNGGDAKASTSGGGAEQRPRLTRLKVTVPPKWTPDEMLVADSMEALKEEEAMHAPLVDCIRSRWQRATCNWHGQEAPSIV